MLFLNDYYFSNKESIKYKSIIPIAGKSTLISTPAVEKDIEIKTPLDVKDIDSSYDGKYISYYTSSTLNLVNTSTGEKKEILSDSKSIKSFHKWLTDRNIIIIAENQINNGKNIIKFYSYDVKNNIKKQTEDYMNNREAYINVSSSHVYISDIAFNVSKIITYPKISTNSKTANIYRVDVALPIEKLALSTRYIGKIKVANLFDQVIYEDSLYKKIYFGNDQKPLSIKGFSTEQLHHYNFNKQEKMLYWFRQLIQYPVFII